MIYKDEFGDNVYAKCNCGCTVVELACREDEEGINDDVFVTFYRDGNGKHLSWKEKIIGIICILNNRYSVQEIILKKNKLRDFANEILKLTDNNK